MATANGGDFKRLALLLRDGAAYAGANQHTRHDFPHTTKASTYGRPVNHELSTPSKARGGVDVSTYACPSFWSPVFAA
eukprot:1519344-Pleurochrysis_carterae.AAC.2